MTILCDTNIISELARPQPNPEVLAWSAQVSSISLSVITLEDGKTVASMIRWVTRVSTQPTAMGDRSVPMKTGKLLLP